MKKALVLASTASMIDQFNMENIALLQRDYEVHVACNFLEGNTCSDAQIRLLQQRLEAMGVPFFQVDITRNVLNLPQVCRAYRQTKELFETHNYAMVHCHSPIGGAVCRLAAIPFRKKGMKVLYTAHGFHFFRGAPLLNWLIYYPIEWCLAHVTDILLTINKEDHARANKHIHAKRIEYIPGIGIDTTKFGKSTANRQEKRRELGLQEDAFVILTVAEMNKNKNHTVILKALGLLKDRPGFEHIQYLICGQGDLQPQLQAEAEALGIGEQVHFLGFRSDVQDIYRCSDIYAFMSFREGLSVALMEAMSCGLPPVCSPIRGNTDLVEHGVEGLLADFDPQVVAEAIWRLYRDPELRARMGSAAAKKITRFDKESVQARMEEIYGSIR